MAASFTPGPWVSDQMGAIYGPDGKPIMTCGPDAVRFGEGTVAAMHNAFLIAAAPKLYSCLAYILNSGYIDNDIMRESVYEILKEAENGNPQVSS